MATYKIIILEQAIFEIAESCLYYNKKLPGLGFEFEEEIFQLLELIKNNPYFSQLNSHTFTRQLSSDFLL